MASLKGHTVLVTGATGFIGRHLINRLLADEATVWSLSRRADETIDPLVHQVVSSLENLRRSTWERQGKERFDIVFHLGAFTPKNKESANKVQQIFEANVGGTKCLLDSFLSPPSCFVFASTLDVYAPTKNGEVLNESSSLCPVTLYGSSKLFCEDLVRHWAQEVNAKYAVLRIGHVYGQGEEAYRKIIPETIRRIMRSEQPILYGNGEAKRDFIHVNDVVEAAMRAAQSKKPSVGPVNIVRGSSLPIKDVVELIMDITGFKGSINFVKSAQGVSSFIFDNSLMKNLLGEWPLISLRDGLCQEIENFRNELPSFIATDSLGI